MLSFRIRGLVEGFYGTPWTMSEREAALKTLSAHGLNAYFYGPKDDPFCCRRWDEPYDRPGLDALGEMLQICRRCALNMRYMLAPGFSICYASEDHRARLIAKYRQVYEIGLRDFVLLLDDIPERLVHAEDVASYPSLVDAHISLCNFVWAQLGALPEPVTLAVCPTQYWGPTDGDYIVRLGRGIPPEIPLIFTGDRICAEKLTTAEARAFFEHTSHRPLYWDNYPVNDAEMVDELHIGPVFGRDADLPGAAEGIIFNPMEFKEASMISLITAAHYMLDSARYDPEQSYEAAVAEVLGESYIDAMRWLNALCYKSCLLRHGHHYRSEAPARYHSEFGALVEAGDLRGLIGFSEVTRHHVDRLRGCPNRAFVRETARWLDAALRFADAMDESVRLYLSGVRGEEAVRPLDAYLSVREDVMKHEAQMLRARLTA